MKIIYFTSTGNCLAVGKRFDAELLSIPQLEREKNYEIEVVGKIFLHPEEDNLWKIPL